MIVAAAAVVGGVGSVAVSGVGGHGVNQVDGPTGGGLAGRQEFSLGKKERKRERLIIPRTCKSEGSERLFTVYIEFMIL